jgi:hypothetical protein
VDWPDIFIGFLVGILSSILVVRYTLKESDRWRVNQCLELLSEEINWNKNKFRLLKETLYTAHTQWHENRTINSELFTWNDEILITEQGPVFRPFKLDAFNFYKNSDIPSFFGISLDYRLTQLYGAEIKFSYDLSQSYLIIKNASKTRDFNKLDLEFTHIAEIFEEYNRSFMRFSNTIARNPEEICLYGVKKAGIIEWHLTGKRGFMGLNIIYSNKPVTPCQSSD